MRTSNTVTTMRKYGMCWHFILDQTLNWAIPPRETKKHKIVFPSLEDITGNYLK